MTDYRIVLADEHRMFQEGVEQILLGSERPRFSVTAKVSNGKDLITTVDNESFDVLVFEVNFVDIEPFDLIKRIKSLKKDFKLFVLSAYGDMKLVKECFRLGVDGYLLKSSNSADLINGLVTVLQDEVYIGENLQVAPNKNGSNVEIGDVKKKEFPVERFSVRQKLTNREKEVLGFVCEGISNKGIASQLYISEHTVRVHRKHILKKLNLNTTADLIDFVDEFDILIKV